jgi:hypothetical protein
MSIKIYSKSGRSRVLSVDSHTLMAKIVYKFDRWEYAR